MLPNLCKCWNKISTASHPAEPFEEKIALWASMSATTPAISRRTKGKSSWIWHGCVIAMKSRIKALKIALVPPSVRATSAYTTAATGTMLLVFSPERVPILSQCNKKKRRSFSERLKRCSKDNCFYKRQLFHNKSSKLSLVEKVSFFIA